MNSTDIAKAVLADSFMRGRDGERAREDAWRTAELAQEWRQEVERLQSLGLPRDLLITVLGRAIVAGREYQLAIHDHGPMSAEAKRLSDAWNTHLKKTAPRLGEEIDEACG